MYIFIDESGSTDEKNKQKFLVIAFAITSKAFAEKLIFKIRDQCRLKGKPIKGREVKYHDLTPFQKEIAVKEINSEYRNFYLCFFDVSKADEEMVTGKYEQRIQTESISHVLSKLDRTQLKKEEFIKVIMDKKLTPEAQSAIEDILQGYLRTKKGISVKTSGSSRERGIQLADLIAGAFRAKLMKKSDLFEVDYAHVFQISATDIDQFRADGIQK